MGLKLCVSVPDPTSIPLQVMNRDGVQSVSGVLRALQDLYTVPATPAGFTVAGILRSITPVPLVKQVAAIATNKVCFCSSFGAKFLCFKKTKTKQKQKLESLVALCRALVHPELGIEPVRRCASFWKVKTFFRRLKFNLALARRN